MHVLFDDARMLGDDVFRDCFCFNLLGVQFGVPRSMRWLSQKVSIQSAVELRSIEHDSKITYKSSNDVRLLKVYESRDLTKLPLKTLS